MSGGRKRCLESEAPALYSTCRVTAGKMVAASDTSPSCGVIFSGWPSWCVGLHLRGWNLKIIIHKNSLWVSHQSSWFPTATIIDIKDVLTTFNLDGVEHWFSDVESPQKLGLGTQVFVQYHVLGGSNTSSAQIGKWCGTTFHMYAQKV